MDAPLTHLPTPPTTSNLLGILHSANARQDGGPRSVGIDSQSTIVMDGVVPAETMQTIWQHAFRRGESEAVLIMPTQRATRSPLLASVANTPGVDPRAIQALSLVNSVLQAQSPENLHLAHHNGLSVTCFFRGDGALEATRLALSPQPLNSLSPLLDLTPKPGYRSFDAFYHLLYSQKERAELLSLKVHPAQYNFLSPSNTYTLPPWVVDADDHSLAKDWDDAVQTCLSKDFRRAFLATLSGILLLGNDDENDRADGAALIGLDAEKSASYPPRELAAAAYIALVQALVREINVYLTSFDLPASAEEVPSKLNSLPGEISIVEGTPAMRRDILKCVFDNKSGINAELVADGISLPKTPPKIAKELKRLSSLPPPAQLSIIGEFDEVMHSSVRWHDSTQAPHPSPNGDNTDKSSSVFSMDEMISSNRIWIVLALASASTARDADTWDTVLVSEQVRDYYLTEWINRRAPVDYTADFGLQDFMDVYRIILPTGPGIFQLENWALQRGYEAKDFFYGRNRIYVSEAVFCELENELLDALEGVQVNDPFQQRANTFSRFSSQFGAPSAFSFDNLNQGSRSLTGAGHARERSSLAPVPSVAQTMSRPGSIGQMYDSQGNVRQVSEYFDEDNYDEYSDNEENAFNGNLYAEEGTHLEVYRMSARRRAWVTFVWMLTFWIPSFVLKLFGMKRRDIRMAWREKLTIFFLIFLLNAAIIFYMIFLGKFICPDYDKVWNHKQLRTHQGTNDFYVGIHGQVYDITKFYKRQHSDNGVNTSPDLMLEVAGLDISDYFIPPLYQACPSLVTEKSLSLEVNTTMLPLAGMADHTSGSHLQTNKKTALHNDTWYDDTFTPAIRKYHKGRIVQKPKEVEEIANSENKNLFIVGKRIFDVTNYMLTIDRFPSQPVYSFFPSAVENLFETYLGQDATEQWNKFDESTQKKSMECLESVFYYGEIDFRDSAKCQAANVILLVIAAILTTITIVKFLASIRLVSKPLPSIQNRFVICQVPAYTESEDELRLAIDSLTSLDYDNKRKLMVIVCDGLIVGAGNDLPTPEIVLDILGHGDRSSAQPQAYHAIAEGSKELNHAKVYSGIYEHEGNAVPYIVIVKVGTPEEQDSGLKPGNRGKRDSQLILMNFLNRVHYQKPMCPLDLELFHHMNNIVGIEPERYEYLFTVDADTRVRDEALTRLVAACTNDNSIAAVCGETSIENEQQSLSTMIQVYEYFISHHLTKAFESLFGSVTCLPGCFSLFRLRSPKKSRPILISDEVIRDYSLRQIDTLHEKNLFSLGEDRYLTTLMSKYFPHMKLKFVADARCQTQVPSDFKVLLSQRRRWINSTVHNLVELLRLDTMCGFFVFSMRGVVFVDLLGTMMLPSVVIYLGYLIYVIASHSSPLPIISIILIGVVYGLQTLVYILHRRWQHIFWMIVYLLAYPIHSFILPIYSFWNMDNFSWGNTRMVQKEADGKKVILAVNEDHYDPQSVPFEPWADYAHRLGLEGEERPIMFDSRRGRIDQQLNVFDTASVLDPETKSVQALSVYSRPLTGDFGSLSVFDAGTRAQIESTIKQVLTTTDLDTMTPRQLREKVADLLGVQFTRERAVAVDQMIDDALELMEESDEGFEAPDDPFEAKPEGAFKD